MIGAPLPGRVAVTRWRQLRGRAPRGESAVRVGDIVRYDGARTARRLTAIAVLALAFYVAVVGAEWAVIGGTAHTHHGPHALAAASSDGFSAIIDHPHAEDGSTPSSPDSITHAVLPRLGALAAVGLFVAMAGVLTLWQHRTTMLVRGPPQSSTIVLAGQQLLTRLCIARR